MSSHPSTFAGEPATHSGPDWDARATLHRCDGGGLLDSFTAIRSGTFAMLVRAVAALHPSQRAQYRIAIFGDRQYGPLEIEALARTRNYRVDEVE